ncbi:hypothetical protein DXG01_003797 [Tephrocybe rancida]|nr:hypothetical protein DXG01_003797 [Tephrocybe rancida]
MFSRLFAVALVALTFSGQAQAHAAIAPALGVAGTPKRSDVQRPSTAKPCGSINIAANINTATPIVAAADGSFVATVTNFNAGKDGSRQVSLTVDATGAGKTFVAGKVATNGDLAPTSVGSQKVTASLPAGTKCTGGTSGNLCLASFKTAAGFGNCVVVQQASAGTAATAVAGTAATAVAGSAAAATSAAAVKSVATPASAAAATAASAVSTAAAGTSTAVAAEAPPKKHHRKGKHAAAGTRAARALRAGLHAGGQLAKRNPLSWIWA